MPPGPIPPHRVLVALLALVAGLAPGCRRAGSPGTREVAGPPAAAAPAPAAPAVAVARLGVEDELSVSPAQLAAGIPHVRFRIEVGDAPRRGPDDAPVTVVMFSDFECPFCRVGSQIVRALERAYPGQIRFAYKAFPIDRHPNALFAALVAHSAHEQGKFWPFFDRLFGEEELDPTAVHAHARAVGLDMRAIGEDLESLRHGPAVKRDMRQARRLEVSSTPTFFINGRLLRGAQPIEAFELLVEQELALAREWTAAGVAPSAVYEHATARGWTEIVYEGRRPELDDGMLFPVPVEDSPQQGPPTAPITIVAFGDFQCPFCARGFETIQALRARYGDELRLVHKSFPLPGHGHALAAARASLAAHEQGRFWDFHDELYRRGSRFAPEDLELIAMRLGLNVERFAAAVAGSGFDARIERDVRLGTRLGVTGTPTYFINGRPLDGARSEIEFRLVIAEERERVAKLREAGVPPERLYEVLSGQREAPPRPATARSR